jgi:hypothetical protein
MKKMFFGGDDGPPSAKVSDDWPAKLKTFAEKRSIGA